MSAETILTRRYVHLVDTHGITVTNHRGEIFGFVQVLCKYGQIRLALRQNRIYPQDALGRHGSGSTYRAQGFPCVGDVDKSLTKQ